MKTIFRIIAILLMASIVAGGLYLALNGTSLSSDAGERPEPPTLTSSDGQTFQPGARPEGDAREASLGRGFTGVLSTLVKLTVVGIVVGLIQKTFGWITPRNLRLTTGTE